MRILALDRGTKKIGLARRSSDSRITFPLGFLANNADTVANILHLIQKYQIDTIVYGKPHIRRLQEQLHTITELLTKTVPDLLYYSCDEAYTSVQADILLEQSNHPGQDAVAAMYILDTYLETLTKQT